MKKSGLILSSVLFSFFIILSSSAFAHEGEHDDAHGKGSAEHEKVEEGSGSSAMHSGEEYKSGHKEAEEKEEEGSFSYKRHRKEMDTKKKAMQENMRNPAGAAGKMGEGSGKK